MTENELSEVIRSYKRTVSVLCGCIVLMFLTFFTIVIFVVPDVLVKAVEEGALSRRASLLEQVREAAYLGAIDALTTYDAELHDH